VALFARDPASSRQVWSAETGYPADPAYRDFYRDVGFDLEAERLGALAHADGVRLFTGIKYHRITHHRGLGDKELYSPDDAAARAAEHAEHFLSARTGQVEALAASMDRVPLVVAPYDAELFGHWWFEGPEFLDALLRAVHRARPGMETVTLAEALRSRSTNQVVECASSTWGAGGYNEVWVDGASSWMVRHLVRAANEMVDLARSNPRPSALVRRALDQAARELLLSQSSDWPFIMKTRQAVEFAERHGRLHLCRFFRLARDVEAGTVDPSWLADLEWRDNVFPEIDYEVYA
jgi:1,4-alpha-glucan branching enzyme